MLTFDLKNPIDVSKFDNWIQKQKLNKSCVQVKTQADISTRTIDQNKYLHLILTWFAIETGYTLEFVKREYFKLLVNPELFVIEVACKFTGEIKTSLRSSKDLTINEMILAINKFRNWSSEFAGIYLPEANEKEFLNQILIEEKKHKEYL